MRSHAWARARPLLFPCCALLLAACGARGDTTGPRLEASWVGSDTGMLSAPARVSWCPAASRLEITAVRQDQGFGLVLYPVGELEPGSFAAFDPGIDTVQRPGVSAAARWFTDQYVAGFQSDSGSLELQRSGAGFDASFGLRLRALNTEDTLRVNGRVRGLVPGPCPVDSVPPAAPVQ